MLTVILSSTPNPDYNQYGQVSPTLAAKVKTVKDAVSRCAKYIASYDLGGGNWDGGSVYDDSDRLIARISYNGRIELV